MMAIALTTNARFKQGYARCVGYSLLGAAAIHFLLFLFFPAFDFPPVEIEVPPPPIIVLPDDVVVPPEPGEVIGPPLEIVPAADGELIDDVELQPNVYRGFSEIPVPTASPLEEAREFYPFDEAPVLITYVTPVYPELMRQAGIEGTVYLLVLVGADGSVRRVSVLQSDVTPAMERAAMAAAKRFLFRPAKQGAFCVEAQMMVPVVFSLH
jgi:protein TonB